MTSNLMIPTTVLEFNGLNTRGSRASHFLKEIEQAFDDIPVDNSKKLKREYSLPAGVQDWNIPSIYPYLDFEDNATNNDLASIDNDDRVVPEAYVRRRCPSGSSASSFNDDSGSNFHTFGIKSCSTISVDSGSTCYTSDSSYNQKFHGRLDPGETYQNISKFLGKVSEKTFSTASLSSLSSLPSTSSDSAVELTVLQPYRPYTSGSSNVFMDSPLAKRRLDSCSEEDEILITKETKIEFSESVMPSRYKEIRRKNNIASKNCRKTRREKQKDMEVRVSELEQERENLRETVQKLEESIKAHTAVFHAISQKIKNF